MSILCWNCRGFGNWQTVQVLSDLVWAQDPIVMFLVETWLDEFRLVGYVIRFVLVIIMGLLELPVVVV